MHHKNDKSKKTEKVTDRERFIRKIEKLPTLPVIVYKILETLENPRSSAKDLRNTILNDQSISAKILRLANSAYYGYNRQVTDITQALVLLGFETVKSISLSVSVINAFPESDEEYSFKREDLWKHAMETAYGAKVIFENAGFKNTERVFIHGLLHDIGKIIMAYYYPVDYEEAFKLSQNNNIDIQNAEKEIFGFDHTEAGYWLGQQWQFPKSILSGIRYHHDPFKAPRDVQESAFVIYLANALTYLPEISNGPNSRPPEINSRILDNLRLSESDLESIIEAFKSIVPQIESFFSAVK